MNFEKAYKELISGKKVRRKEWEKIMHIRYVEGKFRTFKAENTNIYVNINELLMHTWNVVDDEDKKELSFIEAVQELRAKKSIRRSDWTEQKLEQFIFIDHGQYVLCREVEFDFMPTWKCINSEDWETMK